MLDHESTSAGLRAELFVADVGRSARFYVQVLGFEVIRGDRRGYTSVGRAGATLGLNAVERLPSRHPIKPRPGERLGLGIEIVLMVDDVAAAHATAAEVHAGVSPLVEQPWGLKDFRLQDPDGYYIRVTGLSTPAPKSSD